MNDELRDRIGAQIELGTDCCEMCWESSKQVAEDIIKDLGLRESNPEDSILVRFETRAFLRKQALLDYRPGPGGSKLQGQGLTELEVAIGLNAGEFTDGSESVKKLAKVLYGAGVRAVSR